MILSIHQPNFFPWYPFFEKISKSNVFVILQNCQFEKNSYTNRFHYNGIWNTMSISKKVENINEKKYINHSYDWNKIKKRLTHKNLDISKYDKYINYKLTDTNINIIKNICRKLNIKTKIEIDYATKLTGTDRILDICRHYKADVYLTSKKLRSNYLNYTRFKKIELRF